ncbi:transcriptional regulator [Aliidiomarina minuta]|uniref:Transcriptional regulator n=1 Tax=Aliidiomarina minuta TaxID=880057 RepID=A0A432W6C8_9GAMM|nr:ChrR family anti-sigma-E factor [Aliidiomarina minuta]RUO25592.1 transcriptional regulator [Aliidiomarina minuta]
MIKSHPSEAMLNSFVSGTLSPALSLIVATHIDMCPRCQHIVSELEQELAEQMLATPANLGSADSQMMLEAIFNSQEPVIEQSSEADNESAGLITLEGKQFHLPRALARQRDRIGPWNKMVGKLWRAPLNLSTEETTNLIYMAEHSGVPEHTHKGMEATLVINGRFNDEFDSYTDGDFILLDGSRQHTPQTSDEDCLTLAVMDQPLHFTSGLSRLLNPFSSIFFR